MNVVALRSNGQHRNAAIVPSLDADLELVLITVDETWLGIIAQLFTPRTMYLFIRLLILFLFIRLFILLLHCRLFMPTSWLPLCFLLLNNT
jgi:hypothetical protein